MKYELPAILHRLHVASGASQEATVAMIRRKTGEGMHQTAFSHYMATDERQRVPSVVTAAAIAAAFNVSIEYLLGEVKDRRPVADLLNRVRELTFPSKVESAAKLLATMPETYQKKYLAAIEADHELLSNERRWRLVEKFLPPTELARIVASVQADDPDRDGMPSDRELETLFELA
jgi:hypothetical protein